MRFIEAALLKCIMKQQALWEVKNEQYNTKPIKRIYVFIAER